MSCSACERRRQALLALMRKVVKPRPQPTQPVPETNQEVKPISK